MGRKGFRKSLARYENPLSLAYVLQLGQAVCSWYRAEDGLEPEDDDLDGVIKWKKKWTMRKVVAVKKREEIDKEIGEAPGNPGYMGKYAKAVNEVLKGLSDTEKKEYMQLAEEWNKSHPPAEIQIRSVADNNFGYMILLSICSQCS